ncbi:hypothetical protein JMJ35_003627 [Cladonia borealis]|uniref:Uncharacterized protein n=1 Tax=Cladonia borealis TaxID=184061 RepID=A0AA39R4Y4_9LECA|nr:hypothetical protein JMJ35_003627 [Cladonia borealis]
MPRATSAGISSYISLLNTSRIAGNSLVDAERPYNVCGGSKAEILFGEIDVDGNEGQASLGLRKRDLLAHPSTYKTEAKDTLGVHPRRASDGTIYVRGFRIRVIEQISH